MNIVTILVVNSVTASPGENELQEIPRNKLVILSWRRNESKGSNMSKEEMKDHVTHSGG